LKSNFIDINSEIFELI